MPKPTKQPKRIAVAKLHREYIISQVRKGRSVRSIAKELGRTCTALTIVLAHEQGVDAIREGKLTECGSDRRIGCE